MAHLISSLVGLKKPLITELFNNLTLQVVGLHLLGLLALIIWLWLVAVAVAVFMVLEVVVLVVLEQELDFP